VDRSGASSFHLIFDKWIQIRGDYFRFDLVFIKKNNQIKIFFLKKQLNPNRNRFKLTGFGSVQFFRIKTDSNWFGSILLGFFWFDSIFFSLGSVRFFPVSGL
jgi:hypothetical protein